MALLVYSDIRTEIDTLVRALYAGNPTKFAAALAALGIPAEGGGVWETITIPMGGESLILLVGSAFGPAADRNNPEDGPDLDTLDHTIWSNVLQGLIAHINTRYETEIRDKVNALINDYNARFGTSFDLLT